MQSTDFDVAIIGGGYSGAVTGLLLRRANPSLRVLILERLEEFDRKVGESTSEISACFLTQVLKITHHLGHHHLAKQGLRLWFANDRNQDIGDCVEIGPGMQARLPGYQVDRSVLDPYLLAQAVAEGCELIRPAVVHSVDLQGAGKQVLKIKAGETERTLTVGWVVDASGRGCVLGRKLGLRRNLDEHPTNSIWARFTGVGDFDSPEMKSRLKKCFAGRSWSTNHLMGYGWWCWIIPLRGGDVSIGLTWDRRLFEPPAGDAPIERLMAHLKEHPIGRMLTVDAKPVEDDIRTYTQLAYENSQAGGDGWSMVGDAAAFTDPFYSPGLDFCSYTAFRTHRDILAWAGGGDSKQIGDQYNGDYRLMFRSWFENIFLNKYQLFGDAELMAASVYMDISSYFLGPVRLAYHHPMEEFPILPFTNWHGRVYSRFMSFYSKRLVKLAELRMKRGIYGSNNSGWRAMYPGFTPDLDSGRWLLQGIRRWIKVEFSSRFRSPAVPSPAPFGIRKPASAEA